MFTKERLTSLYWDHAFDHLGKDLSIYRLYCNKCIKLLIQRTMSKT